MPGGPVPFPTGVTRFHLFCLDCSQHSSFQSFVNARLCPIFSFFSHAHYCYHCGLCSPGGGLALCGWIKRAALLCTAQHFGVESRALGSPPCRDTSSAPGVPWMSLNSWIRGCLATRESERWDRGELKPAPPLVGLHWASAPQIGDFLEAQKVSN